jgi:hypothetical protein
MRSKGARPDWHQVAESSRTANKDPLRPQFTQFDIEKSRGGYLVFNRGGSDQIARLRPIPNTDRFELFSAPCLSIWWPPGV